MKRENINKASEYDSRILQIDQELLKLSALNTSDIIVQKSLLPELYETVRLKKIEALKALKQEYEKVIEDLA